VLLPDCVLSICVSPCALPIASYSVSVSIAPSRFALYPSPSHVECPVSHLPYLVALSSPSSRFPSHRIIYRVSSHLRLPHSPIPHIADLGSFTARTPQTTPAEHRQVFRLGCIHTQNRAEHIIASRGDRVCQIIYQRDAEGVNVTNFCFPFYLYLLQLLRRRFKVRLHTPLKP
jgi:hypothetical protein